MFLETPGQYTKLMSVGEVWNMDWLVKMRGSPSGSALSSPRLQSGCQCPDPFFPHLNPSTHCTSPSQTRSGQSTRFWLSAMVSFGERNTHYILVLSQQLFQINWQLLSGLCIFDILICFLTSVSDGGRAGSQHVSRSRDTRPRKKKRLRFQVNTSIHSFVIESKFEQCSK